YLRNPARAAGCSKTSSIMVVIAEPPALGLNLTGDDVLDLSKHVVLRTRGKGQVASGELQVTSHLPLTTCSCGSARYTSTAYCLTMWQPPSAQVQASIDPREMSARTQPALVRAIGRWSLVALVLN